VPGLKFYAYAIESYGYVDKDRMDPMRALALAASSTGKVKYGSLLASVHREISVALCKGYHAIFRAGVQLYTRASGHARVPGLLIPSADIAVRRLDLGVVCCITVVLMHLLFIRALDLTYC
jgi:hypothetical protein